MKILLCILISVILLAALGWLIITIGAGIASREENDDDI